ncbi:FtsK/SpoIIIE domain-containing protein [Dactylosporangium salmoneum]|uniref:FtsK/SpoIIIE domain-containing protein n=1 Tax=Dactylosporangium salmoneum TaxID=53361 RepID=UPI0031DFDD70
MGRAARADLAGRTEAAAERFRASAGRVRGLLDAARAGARSRAATQRQRLDSTGSAEVRQAVSGAQTRWERAHAQVWAAARALAGADQAGPPPELGGAAGLLDVAGHVRIGSVGRSPKGAAALPPPPVLLPLLGQGNVRVVGDAAHPSVAGVLQTIVLRALTATGLGQLRIAVVDPRLRALHAPFAVLGRSDDPLLEPPATNRQEVEALLARLVEVHQRIAGLVRGNAESLAELSRRAGLPVEPHRLIVVLDFPDAFSEQAQASLLSLMRDGPRYGISILLHHEPAVAVDASAETLTIGTTVTWTTVPQLAIRLDPPPGDAEAKRLAEAIGRAAQKGAAPVLPLADLLAGEGPDGRSAAGGITVPIGRAGRDTVEISLGDSIAQRHNMLVTGAVGQGKSNVLQALVHGLVARYGPDEVELYLLDMREGVSFFPLAGADGRDWLPHARLVGVQADRAYALSVIEHLVDQFTVRAEALRRHDGTYPTFRAREPGTRMPRLILVIDEFQVLFEELDEIAERAAAQLEKLVRMGRGFGIHVVLASQAVSHIPALGPKADIVFAQFPTRLALRNSRIESQATLDQHNDAAAELRYRGEAIINHGFGRREDNLRFVTAWAGDETVAAIRTGAWRRWHAGRRSPEVFDGRRRPGLDTFVGELLRLRRRAGASRAALLGRFVAFGVPEATSVLSSEPGRHLAIVGAGEASAIGMLQAAAVSLALQHPAGDAEFTIFDLLDPVTYGETTSALVDLLNRLGFAPEVHNERRNGAAVVAAAAAMREGGAGVTRYVIGFGLDRSVDLDRPASLDEPESPAEALQALLADGPNRGTHVLAWWASAGAFSRQRGHGEATMPASLVALRMDGRSLMDLVGPGLTWGGADDRALLWAPRDAGHEVLVPAAPLDARAARALLRVEWDG